MRYTLFIASLFVLFSCAKQRMIDRLEGRWNYSKMLKNNGEYVYHSEVYEFTGGDKDNDAGFPFVVYGQDTIHGTYRITKKNVIKVKEDLGGEEIDWLIEDMDKNSLVFRIADGVVFLDKQQ